MQKTRIPQHPICLFGTLCERRSTSRGNPHELDDCTDAADIRMGIGSALRAQQVLAQSIFRGVFSPTVGFGAAYRLETGDAPPRAEEEITVRVHRILTTFFFETSVSRYFCAFSRAVRTSSVQTML